MAESQSNPRLGVRAMVPALELRTLVTSFLVSATAFGQEIPAPPVPGDAAPPLSFEKLIQAPDGAVASWDRLRGKFVVLEFWATWCGPCVMAIPHMNALSDAFRGESVQFIAITSESQAAVSTFLAKKPIHGW